MALLQLLLFVATFLASPATADNNYPIVFVHGFAGYGPDENKDLPYWGKMQGNFIEDLNRDGYTVYAAKVGPFSSNWDRACELYARIKGGTVNYGTKHSSHFGHEATAGPFDGLYPEWGEEDENGNVKKVHLVGHSMGGQTIKMLAHLLAKGTAGAPVEEDPSSHELFAGGHDWVASVTTISSPNQGTLLASVLSNFGDFVKDLLISFLALVGATGNDTAIGYDVMLDQWGVQEKGADESFIDYIDRILSSKIFNSNIKDVCLWSLSTDGAAEENSWVTTLSNVYYFSYSTLDSFPTRNLLLQPIHLPNILTMYFPLTVVSTFLGSRYGPNHGFTELWQPNDGVVNTISMGDIGDGNAVSFKKDAQTGIWNQMAELDHLDHLAVTGNTMHTEVYGLYKKHAELLYSLDESSGSRRLSATPADTADDLENAITTLKQAAASIQTKADFEAKCAKMKDNVKMQRYCELMRKNMEEIDQTEPRRLRSNEDL